MKSNENKYHIEIDGKEIEVTEAVYRAYHRPIWNARYHAQKNAECRCRKNEYKKCDGICPGCQFYTAGKKVSLERPIGDKSDRIALKDTLVDKSPSAEDILCKKELFAALHQALKHLNQFDRNICYFFMEGRTEREIASAMGKSQSTINYRKNKIFLSLYDELKEYFY